MNLIRITLKNPVAMNLVLLVLLCWGMATFYQIPREVFPEFEFDLIQIQVVYPGATPDEIEESITVPIEERVSRITGIEEIKSTSAESLSSIMIEVNPDFEPTEIRDKIESEINQIMTFPRDSEKPKVTNLVQKRPVIFVGIYGDISEEALKEYSDGIRDELLMIPSISQVDYLDAREREISIEISEEKLQQYQLTFAEVAAKIRSNSLNLPGGTIKSRQGEVLLRTMDQKYTGQELEKMIILSTPNGSRIYLKDIAEIHDSFKDVYSASLLDGVQAKVLRVYKTGNQDLIEIADEVKKFVENKQKSMPGNLKMINWGDVSRLVKGRLALMEKNGYMGLILVFITLALFLELRLAFFVALGIPVCFLGSFIFMHFANQSINMISMFGMILVLGIVVDDAVVVSESIFQKMKEGKNRYEAAFLGTIKVLWPVLASVSTTIVAFVPLYFVEGTMGKFFAILPFVVIMALLLSLLESLFILPGHLADHLRLDTEDFLSRTRIKIQNWVHWFVTKIYLRAVKKILKYRYAALGGSLGILILSLGLITGDRIDFVFMPKTDQDIVKASVEFPTGTDYRQSQEAADLILAKLWETQELMKKNLKPDQKYPFIEHVYSRVWSGGASFTVELFPAEERNIFYDEILEVWREKVGQIPEAISLVFETRSHGPGGKALELQIIGNDFLAMEKVSDEIQSELKAYPFVKDLRDNARDGKLEARLILKPLANNLGLNLADVAGQLQKAYFGEQALRIQRGKDDIRVYVRYPKAQRDTLDSLLNQKIRTKNGLEIPFREIGSFHFTRGYSSINHTARFREITISADVDSTKGSSSRLVKALKESTIPQILAQNPGVQIVFRGQAQQRQKSLDSLFIGFVIALLVIYSILASIFRSYIQPVIIMFAIPFGFIGAVFGHVLMGFQLSIMSMFGLVALTGIVVNNSLLLIDFINRRVRAGAPFLLAVVKAGKERFMAIFLTTVTTFVGVTPMLYERSMQAQFLKPCVISLAFGLIVSAAFTLLLIPSIYVILYDIYAFLKRLYHGRPYPREFLLRRSSAQEKAFFAQSSDLELLEN